MSDVMHFRAEDIIAKRQWVRDRPWYAFLGGLAIIGNMVPSWPLDARGVAFG